MAAAAVCENTGVITRADSRNLFPGAAVGLVCPDVLVTESWDAPGGLAVAAAGVAVAEMVVLFDPEPSNERSVQVMAAGGRPVTAIEVLSPTNKMTFERRLAYRRKRRTYQEGGVNVVEIDRCYVRGRYHERLVYHTDPEPTLKLAEAQGADQLLRTAGLRS